jgi:hypothetical protein
MMKIAMLIGIALFVGVFTAVAQSGYTSSTRICVTEEVRVNDVLQDSRDTIFFPVIDSMNADQAHLVSTNGAGFLNFSEFRLQGTNIWFRKWEYGRKSAIYPAHDPMYMLAGPSISFKEPPGFHIAIGDKIGLRYRYNQFIRPDQSRLDTYIVIKADND